jgi:hypothetical protein
MFPDGGPALEASWSHPTLKKALALLTPAQSFILRDGMATLLTTAVTLVVVKLPVLWWGLRRFALGMKTRNSRQRYFPAVVRLDHVLHAGLDDVRLIV